MEINLVVLSLGNSRLAVGTFRDGELSGVQRILNSDVTTWQAAIAEAWKALAAYDNATIVAAGVNPPLKAELEEAVLRAANRRLLWIGKDIETPIRVLTQSPENTGVDRILNVAAAYEQMEHACVVVDAGTAITVDCCNDLGEFLGGAIAPGVSMQLTALHEKTAALPLIKEFEVPDEPFGRSTEQAMLHGVYHGIRGMVKEVVENYATALGRWPDVIATGGDASKLFAGWDLMHAIAPDLTLYGIALAYTEHHISQGT